MKESIDLKNRYFSDQRRIEKARLQRTRTATTLGLWRLPGSAQWYTQGETETGDIRFVLGDLQANHVIAFLEKPMPMGQAFTLRLFGPMILEVTAKLTSYREVDSSSRIMGQTRFAYRGNLRFVFESSRDRAAVEEFIVLCHLTYGQAGQT